MCVFLPLAFKFIHRVKLLVNRTTQEAVAMKVLNSTDHPEAAENFKKEICVHRLLNHEHIIKYFGHRKEGNSQFIFLEYASGGELFDRIGKFVLL